jgi:Domain of unknown function (DUF4188)
MNRVIARLPESITELCLVRLGIQVKSPSAWFFARRLRSAIVADSRRAIAAGSGLLNSEFYAIAMNHFGVLQYWRSFDELETWARYPPHSEWWRTVVERMRLKRDIGIYHETFLVRAADIESISMNCRPVGLETFGVLGEPVGPNTTSRGRLGRGRA